MVPFALLVWLPVAYSIHILVPSNTTVDLSTTVTVIFENSDASADIFLKEFEVDNNEFDKSVLFPVAFSTSTVSVNMTFLNIQNYVVVAVTNPQDWTLADALARSLEIQVLDDDDDDDGDRWGRHGRHRGDHNNTDDLTSSIPQASASVTASLDMGDGNNDSDHQGRRSSNHLSTAVIIGLIFGVSAFWVLLGLLVYCLIRRRGARHSTERQSDKNTTPFDLRTSHPFDDSITNRLDQEAQLSRGKRTWREAMALGRHRFRSPSNETTRTIYTDSRSRFFVGQPNRLPAQNPPHSLTSHGSSAQMRSPQTEISHRDSRCDATPAIEVVQVPVDVHHPFRFADPFPPDYVSVQTIERDDFDERTVPRRTL